MHHIAVTTNTIAQMTMAAATRPMMSGSAAANSDRHNTNNQSFFDKDNGVNVNYRKNYLKITKQTNGKFKHNLTCETLHTTLCCHYCSDNYEHHNTSK